VRWVLLISDLLIPLVFFGIIMYGLLQKVDVFDTFVEGAGEGFKTIINIMPTIIGLFTAIGMFRASGALDLVTRSFAPLVESVGFPAPLLPIALMRTISSSAANGLVLDLFKTYGPDSFIGRAASVMMGCTETIFYTLSVYFMTVNIKNTRYTVAGALCANIAGIIASIYITNWIFGF